MFEYFIFLGQGALPRAGSGKDHIQPESGHSTSSVIITKDMWMQRYSIVWNRLVNAYKNARYVIIEISLLL